MAICKMLEMKLVGTECDEAALMNALHKTGAVELKPVGDVFSCEKRKPDERELEYLKSELVMDKLLDLLLSEAVFEDKPAEEPAKKPAAKRSTSKTTAKKSTKDTEGGEKPAAKKSTRTTKKASEEPKAE